MNERIARECVRVPGSAVPLRGELAYSWGSPVRACLLISPHPHMGGRMDNPLIMRLAMRLAEDHAVTLRFEYSCLGDDGAGHAADLAESMARFWESGTAPIDPGMLADARAAHDWLHRQTGLPVVLVGYSFGAYAAAGISTRATPAIVLISPAILRHEYAFVQADVPKLVVYSDDDFAAPLGELEAWSAALPGPTRRVCVPGSAHFFRGRESEVAEHCAAFVRHGAVVEVTTR